MAEDEETLSSEFAPGEDIATAITRIERELATLSSERYYAYQAETIAEIDANIEAAVARALELLESICCTSWQRLPSTSVR